MDSEIIKKWENMGFLENIQESLKAPLSFSYEKIFLFIKDLDDNKRFNHADLQEISDICMALVYDVISSNPDHKIDTDNIYKIFFNTPIRDIDDDKLSKNYGQYPVYLFIRNYIIPDNGNEINNKINDNVEYLLTDQIIKYYNNNYLQ